MKLAASETQRAVMTVSEITRDIRTLLEDSFGSVWVEGEITNYKRHSSGHLYFSLKDEAAQIGCVMFRSEAAKLLFEPGEGLSVLCRGRVSVYTVRGQYQLYVERIEPKGVGALELQFRELKEKLAKEGLFDEARKRPIPYLPSRIAIVSSADGAALRDILNVVDRRFPGAHLLIYPVAVQGPGAAEQIAEAIDSLNREQAADVMIVGRGGGSLEDLWAFNEESVARAIFSSEIPVISAVGHEVDFTIADFVADLRAATPSAAAEIVLPLKAELEARVAELKKSVLFAFDGILKDRWETLRHLAGSRVLKDPLAIFQVQFQRLDELKKNLSALVKNSLLLGRERALALIGKLEALGPLNILKRGFSATLSMPGEQVISSARSVKTGDSILTKLQDGFLKSRVTEVHHE